MFGLIDSCLASYPTNRNFSVGWSLLITDILRFRNVVYIGVLFSKALYFTKH